MAATPVAGTPHTIIHGYFRAVEAEGSLVAPGAAAEPSCSVVEVEGSLVEPGAAAERSCRAVEVEGSLVASDAAAEQGGCYDTSTPARGLQGWRSSMDSG